MIDIETMIAILASFSGACAIATAVLKDYRKHAKKAAKVASSPPKPAKSKVPQWEMQVVSEEVATRGLGPEDRMAFSMHRRVTWMSTDWSNSQQYDERLQDFVLVQIIRRRTHRDSYGHMRTDTDTLRIGAVDVKDPEFDRKLAEFRGFAQERIDMLNGVME